MRKLDRPRAGKLLTDRIDRVSATAVKVDFGAWRPPGSAPSPAPVPSDVSAAFVGVDDRSYRDIFNDAHRPLSAGAANAGARVAHGSIRP